MRQYVIGNDIDDISWEVFQKYELPEDFSQVTNMTMIARHSLMPTVVMEPSFERQENTFAITILAASIKRVGEYDLELAYQKVDEAIPGGIRTCRVTFCRAFEIVNSSCEVDLPANPLEIAGIIAPLKGYSAYEVFVHNGFEGTEEEWEQHLRQPAIDAAETASRAAELADEARLSIQDDLKLKLECIIVSDEEYNDL